MKPLIYSSFFLITRHEHTHIQRDRCLKPPITKLQVFQQCNVCYRKQKHRHHQSFDFTLRPLCQNIKCEIVNSDSHTKPTIWQKRPISLNARKLPPRMVMSTNEYTMLQSTRGISILLSRLCKNPCR